MLVWVCKWEIFIDSGKQGWKINSRSKEIIENLYLLQLLNIVCINMTQCIQYLKSDLFDRCTPMDWWDTDLSTNFS